MFRPQRSKPPLFAAALALLAVMAPSSSAAQGAKSTECTKIGICYCVSAELKPAIETRIARFRQLAAEQRKAGKAIGYLSVPLSPAGGGYMKLNFEVAEGARAAIEKRFGADFVWVLNPGTAEPLPNGSGADYMLMWTSILEGRDGLGEDLDFVYFAGPQDFARVLELDGTGDMAKLDQYFDKRLKADPELDKAVKSGLTKAAFRTYYALKASSAFSRGAHDEWNIIRTVNERRRNDPKYGIANQLPVLFDGLGIAPSGWETTVSDGYAGKCAI